MSQSLPLGKTDSLNSWIIALLAHLVIFSTWGFTNAFGVFQTYYVFNMHLAGNSDVAWIGSVQIFLVFSVGIVAGRALDAGYYRIVFAGGSLLYILGLFALSFCTQYWQIFLAHAVCVGLGSGAVFAPTVALTGTYFDKHKSLALGLVTIGSANGGMVFSAIASQMLPKVGFPWTVRTMAFVQLAIAIVCGTFLKPCTAPRKSGSLIEWAALRNKAYVFALLGAFFMFWAVFLGFYFIGSYGRTIIGVSQSTGVYLLLAMNGIGVIGRIIVSTQAARYGPVAMMVPATFLNGLFGYCWIGVSSERGLWVFTLFYGIMAAAAQAVYPMVLGSFSKDPRKAGAITGMGFFVAGIAVLTGPPVAGALIQVQHGDFLGVQIMSGTSMMFSTAMFTACLVMRRKE